MAKFKAKVQHDGKEIEVELDDSQFLTREQHEVRLEDTIEKRLARQRKSLKGDLLEDEEFVAEVLKKHPPKNGGSGKQLTDADVERIQNEVREKEVKPLQTQLEAATKEISESRSASLESELTTELINAGVRKSVAARIAKMEAAKFGWDEKSKSHAVREGDGFAFAAKASKERPYKTAAEFAQDWAADKTNADFVDKQGQKGPNLGGAGDGSRATGVASLADLKTPGDRSKYIADHGLEAFQNLSAGK